MPSKNSSQQNFQTKINFGWGFDLAMQISALLWLYYYLHLVQWPSDVNGAVLDDSVYHLRDGCGEVRVAELGVEENLGTKEALVPNIHRE